MYSLAYALRNMGDLLRAQTPYGDLNGYDSLVCRNDEDGFQVAWVPRGDSLGAILPSNHPAVDSIWLMALATKTPTLLKSGGRDPFTRIRLANALYGCGLPTEALYVLYGSYAQQLLTEADRGIIFGGDSTVSRYIGLPEIKVYGPGRSKAVVLESSEETLQSLFESITTDGGMGCINLSAIASLDGSGKEVAEWLSDQFKEMEICDILDESARVPAIDEDLARRFDALISSYLAIEGVEQLAPRSKRIVNEAGFTFLCPTVVYVSPESPAFGSLFGLELPFPFVVVSDVDLNYLERLDDTLTLAVFPGDPDLEKKLLRGNVNKIYSGRQTNDLVLTDPHEGFVTDHLFETKAYR